EVAALSELPERTLLELTHTLGGHAEHAAGLAEGGGLGTSHAEAKLDNVALALRELVQRPAHSLVAVVLDDLFLRLRAIGRQKVAESAVTVVAHRLVEARHRLRSLANLLNLLDRQLRGLGDLLLRGLAAELHVQLTLDPRDLALALGDVHRHADRARGVVQPALDRLTDPQRRVRGELEASAPVELLGGANKPDHALLDEVAKRETLALVLLRDGHDEAEVRIDHPILRGHVSALDALGQLDLLSSREQRVTARLVEELLQGIEATLVLPPSRGTLAVLSLESRPGDGRLRQSTRGRPFT